MKKNQCGGSAEWVLHPFVAVVLLICPLQDVTGAAQHQVGGPPGWTLPSMAHVNYTSWASTQTFIVGDRLYFNYSSAYHNVLEVTAAKYASCDASNPLAHWNDGETTIPLDHVGTLYYLCGIPGHCEAGQKVEVEVVASETGTQHQVGGAPGWSLPSRSNVNYTDWASTQSFHVGDTLYFNYSSAYHNVLQVTEAKYNKCDATSPLMQWDNGATIIPLNSTGTFYYICGKPGHCEAGQKVDVLVVEASSNSSSPPQAPGMSTGPTAPVASPLVSAPSPASTSPIPLFAASAVFPLCSLLALSLICLLV